MAKVKEFDKSTIPYLLKLPQKHYRVDYDEGTDTLNISFRESQCVSDSVTEEDIIYNYDGEQLVGIIVLKAKGTGDKEKSLRESRIRRLLI